MQGVWKCLKGIVETIPLQVPFVASSKNQGLPWWLSGKESACNADWVRSLGGEDPLEKKLATYSSILAWRIHGQRSLVGSQSMGLQESDRT